MWQISAQVCSPRNYIKTDIAGAMIEITKEDDVDGSIQAILSDRPVRQSNRGLARRQTMNGESTTHGADAAHLQRDIDRGLADVDAGRVKDFDTDAVVERGKAPLAGRRFSENAP
jgi:hypothetical protein